MADTKDQILVDFQACTGLDDFETCGEILASYDWNLALAVNSVMHDESPTDVGPARMATGTMGRSSESDIAVEELHSPITIDDDASASGPSTSTSFTGSTMNFMPTRMINFNVEYRNKNIPIVLPDSETVGRIKELLEVELSIPVDKQELKGLIKRKVDDSMVLRNLYLPKDNVLYLLTPQLCSPSNSTTSPDRTPVLSLPWDTVQKVFTELTTGDPLQGLSLKSEMEGVVKEALRTPAADFSNFLETNLELCIAGRYIGPHLLKCQLLRQHMRNPDLIATLSLSGEINNGMIVDLQHFCNKEATHIDRRAILQNLGAHIQDMSDRLLNQKINAILKKYASLRKSANTTSGQMALNKFLVENGFSATAPITHPTRTAATVTATEASLRMAQSSISGLRRHLEDSAITCKAATDKSDTLEAELKTKQVQCQKLEAELFKIQETVKGLKSSLADSQAALQTAKGKIKRIKHLNFYRRLQRMERKLRTKQHTIREHEDGGCMKRIQKLRCEKKLEQTRASGAKSALAKYKEAAMQKIRQLEQALADLMKPQIEPHEKIVRLKDNKGHFLPAAKICIMALVGECEVPAVRCGAVIQTVIRQILDARVPESDLPSQRAALRFSDQAHVLTKVHVADVLTAQDHYDLHIDGTSRSGNKYVCQAVNTPDGTYSLGFTPVAKEDTSTLVEVSMQILEELSDLYPHHEAQDNFLTMLRGLSSLMTDRAAVMKSYGHKLQEERQILLQTEEGLNFLHCNAHFLLGIASEVKKVLCEEDKTRTEAPHGFCKAGECLAYSCHRKDEYKLKVVFTRGSEYRLFHFNVKGSKTIGEVKHDLYSIINIPVRLQQWSGWPPNTNDGTHIYESGITFPHMEFEVTEKATTTSSQASTLSTVEVMHSDSDDDVMENVEVDNEDDFFDTQDVSQSRKHKPLMSPDHASEMEATEQFSREFADRYGDIHPVFYLGSLDDAIKDSLQCRATERKLLALYLHHDESIQAHVFCSQLLCSESIVHFLSSNFLTWAWDLTHPENLNRLVTSATKHFGSIAANQIRSYRTEQLPALLIISRAKATNEVLDAIQGHVTLNELMTRLLHAVDVFQEQKNADVAEERERMARESIKQEQDMAYQESLEADRKKALAARELEQKKREALEKQMALEMEVERKRQEEEAVKEAIQESIAKSVPEEPAENATGAISKLRFRVPGGKQITRRFWADNTLQDVLNFLTGQGFHTEEYKVLTTYPRRDITQLDLSQTLQAAKLFPQETLILEEKQ